MSNTIDKRVVKIDFDNEQFESRTKTTIGTLEKLKQALTFSHANDGLDTLNKSVKGFNMNPLAAGVDAVGVKFNALQVAAFTALQNIVNRAVNAGIQVAKSLSVDQISAGFGEYELKMGSIQTIMASTGEDLETVSAYLEELNTYADKTIYSFSDMTSNIGKFTNAGVKLEDAVKAIQGVSNEAAVSGANANEASRAMYNFAQALSAGYVKLIDWKSIENANMATVEFKDQLIETAVALGTVVKEGDMYRSTTTDLNGHVSELFDTTHMFNDSLSSQWMTTDVLVQALNNYSTDIREMTSEEVAAYEEKLRSIGYTEEQIKKIEELGQKAFDSAQDVKTFSQLMDTLKESVGSGWAQTFEIIFGNFEEAKSLWTSINDYIGDVLQKQADARNDLLKEWKSWGGRDMLMRSFVNVFEALRRVLIPVRQAFKSVFPIDVLKTIKRLTLDFYQFTQGLNISGTTAVRLKGTFEGFFSIIGIGVDIIKEVAGFLADLLIPALSGGSGTVLEFTNNLGRNIKAFREWLKENGYIRTALELIKSLVEELIAKVKEWVSSFKPISTIKESLSNFKEQIGKFSEEIAKKFPEAKKKVNDLFSSFKNFAKTGEINKLIENFKAFSSTFKKEFLAVWNEFKVSDTFSPLIKGITDLWNKIKTTFSTKMSGIFTPFVEALTNLWNKVKSIFAPVEKTFDSFGESSKKLTTKIDTSTKKVDESFQKMEDVLAPVAKVLRQHIGDITGALMLLFTAKTLKTLVKDAKTFGKGLVSSVKLLAHPLETIGGLVTETKNALRSYSQLVGAAKNALNGLALLEVVIAIGALAYLLVKLKDYKLEDFKTGAIVVGAIAIVVMAILALIAQINKYKSRIDPGLIKKQSSAFLKIVELAAAVYLVVKSFTSLYSVIKEGNIIAIVGAAAGVVGGLFVLIKVMGQLNKMGLGDLNWKSLLAMIGAASALKLIVSAFSDLYVLLKDAKFRELKEPLIAFGGAIGALFLIINQLSKAQTVKGVGGNLLLSVISLKVLISVLKDLTTLDLSGIGDHIGSFILVVGSFALLMKALSKMPASSGGAGGGILAAAIAVRVLAGAIKMIGSMELSNIVKGTAAVGSMLIFMGVFAKLADGANIPVKTAVTFLALSVAVGILALIVVALGLLNPQDVLVGTAAIDSMLICIGAVLVAAKLAEGVKVGPLFVLVAAFGVLATALVLILQFADDSKSIAVAAAALDSLMVCFSVLVAVTGLVSKAGRSIGAGLAAVGVLTLIVAGLAGILYLLASNVEDSTKALECAEALTLLMLSMSAVMLSAAIVGTVGVVALAGIAIGAAVVAAFAALLYAFSSVIDEHPDIETKLDRMGEVMNKIGNVFGQGVAGFLEGATSSLKQVGQNLSDFADSSSGFFDAMAGITPEMGQGVQNMATALLTLSGTDLVNTIVTALGGNVGSFGTTLTSFGQALIDYSDVLAGGKINADAITKSAEAGQALADLQNSLSKTGGLWQDIAGAEDIQDFGKKIVAFANMLRDYNRKIVGAKIDVDAITTSATAGQVLADLQNSLSKTGGLWQGIAGAEDIGDFGKKINAFAEAIISYSDTVSGFTYTEGGAVQSVTACATDLSGLAETIKTNSSGSTLSDFGDDLNDFGYNISLFYTYLADVDTTKLSAIATDLESITGVAGSMTGFDTSGLDSFAQSMSTFATDGISKFTSAFGNAGPQVVPAMVNFLSLATTTLTSGSSTFTDAGTAAVTAYTNAFSEGSSQAQTIGKTLVAFLVSALELAVSKFTTEGKTAVNNYLKEFQNGYGSAKVVGTALAANAVAGLGQYSGSFSSTGANNAAAFVNAISGYTSRSYSAGASLGSNANAGLRNNVGNARVYGNNFGSGFVAGIQGYGTAAYNAAYSIGRWAVTGLQNAINSHSPSKEAQKSGGYFGIGFTSEILKWVTRAGEAGTRLGEYAIDSLNKAIANVPLLLTEEMDFDPVIRPVVDLSSAEQSVQTLNGMFNKSVGVAAQVASVTGASVAATKPRLLGGDEAAANGTSDTNAPMTIYNTFNITSNDPEEVANAVSRRIQKQVERKEAIWAQSSGTRSPLVRSPS